MAIVALPVSYFVFTIPLATLVYYALGYVVIGLVWSFYRYKRYITDQAKMIRKSNESNDMKLIRAKRLHPTKHIDTITAWIIIWPFSAVDNLVGDFINTIQKLVTTVFKNVYYKIYTSVLGDILKLEE